MSVAEPGTLFDPRTLAKRTRQATLLSLVGFGLVAATLGYSVWQLSQFQRDVTELSNQKRSLEAQISDRRAELARIEGQLAVAQDRLDRAALLADTGRSAEALETVRTAPSVVSPANSAVPRIYFQIWNDRQRPIFTRCRTALVQNHYRVPAPERVSGGPPQDQVRYFHGSREEAAAAQSIAHSLSGCLGHTPQVQLISGYSSVPAMQFEVWFARGTGGSD